jgi:hypothetical protein
MERSMTPDQVDLIKRTIAVGSTNDELAQIVKLAKKLQIRRTKAAAKQKAPEPTAGDGPATNWQTGTQEGSDSRSTGRGGSPSNQAHISPQG